MGEEYIVGRNKDQGFSWGPQHRHDDLRLWAGEAVREDFEQVNAAWSLARLMDMILILQPDPWWRY